MSIMYFYSYREMRKRHYKNEENTYVSNSKQRKELRMWMDTRRYVYNRSLEAVKNGEKINFYALRNKFVTSKNNENVKNGNSKHLKILEQVQ